MLSCRKIDEEVRKRGVEISIRSRKNVRRGDNRLNIRTRRRVEFGIRLLEFYGHGRFYEHGR